MAMEVTGETTATVTYAATATATAAEEQSTMSGRNKKKKKKKRRRVSKHVLESQGGSGGNSSQQQQQASSSTSSKKRRKKSSSHLKDPKEAAAYLSSWKHKDTPGVTWKFNKNTQSWLIRHMYEADKVSKTSFIILLEYLQGLQQGRGTNTSSGDDSSSGKARILAEAKRRALRYKEHEKQKAEKDEGEASSPAGKDDKDDDSDDDEDQTEDTTEPMATPAKEGQQRKVINRNDNDNNDNSSSSNDKDDDDDKDTLDEETKRWNMLDNHEKRKEYKRARKVLDELKVDTEKASTTK